MIKEPDNIEVTRDEDGQYRPLYRMFSKVPRHYDLLNRLLTFGMDRLWRKKAARICLESNPHKVMDLCTGTGDLAIELAEMLDADTEIVAVDFCEPMLEVAEEKARRLGLADRIAFRLADAAALPYNNGYFDVVTIGFGFRNLTFKNPKSEKYLGEISRVVAPGGRLVIVETSQPESAILKALSGLYYSAAVKPLGNAISGETGAYSYLAYSARNFYGPSDVRNMLLDKRFAHVDHYPLWGGIAAVHSALKRTPSLKSEPRS